MKPLEQRRKEPVLSKGSPLNGASAKKGAPMKRAKAGIPILEYKELNDQQQLYLQRSFIESLEPILTPLAVDVSHPFPFISNLGLNLAVEVKENKKRSNHRALRPAVKACGQGLKAVL